MYTFVTVSFEAEAFLLRLQARSMRLYLDPLVVGEIIVIENCEAPLNREELLREYGHLALVVRFLPAYSFGNIPQAAGWWTQQVLKMLAAKFVSFPRYVVLDAKNHLVAPLGLSFLETPDGKISTRRYGYQNHPLRPALQKALAYCDVPAGNQLDLFTPTATPFTMHTASVREVIHFVEAKERKSFAEAFIERQLTEFFLYACRLTKLGKMDLMYSYSQIPCPVIWGVGGSDPLAVLHAIREADERGAPVFAVHRRALVMDAVSREIIAQFWRRRGLVASASDTVRELERFY